MKITPKTLILSLEFLTIIMKPRSVNCDSSSFRNWNSTFLAICVTNGECCIFFADLWDIGYLWRKGVQTLASKRNIELTKLILEGTSARSHRTHYGESASEYKLSRTV